MAGKPNVQSHNHSVEVTDDGTPVPRGLFLGDYMGLETIQGNDVINFFSSTISDGADVHAIRANHP